MCLLKCFSMTSVSTGWWLLTKVAHVGLHQVHSQLARVLSVVSALNCLPLWQPMIFTGSRSVTVTHQNLMCSVFTLQPLILCGSAMVRLCTLHHLFQLCFWVCHFVSPTSNHFWLRQLPYSHVWRHLISSWVTCFSLGLRYLSMVFSLRVSSARSLSLLFWNATFRFALSLLSTTN